MANTVIALKKSATPTAQPTILANGELAINYADGKLFYKHANGTILPFNTQGGNAFGTVNANGTLIVADTTGDILTLEAGNNITITADAINDKITISSTGGGGSNVTVATSQIKDLTSNDYVVTNVATIATVVDSSVAIAAFNQANTFNNVYTTIAGANSVVGTSANAFTSATVSGANTIAIAAFNKANVALSTANTTVAIGSIVQYAANTAPAGTLACDGSAVSRTTYASLFSITGTTYGVGNGSTTFNLPDFRGNFSRGWDAGAGVDSGRVFGSVQTDAFQGHIHNYSRGENGPITTGPDYAGGAYFYYYSSQGTSTPITDGTNGTPRTAKETRPRNIATLFCIKY